jgi:hypothetical protein
LAPCVDEAIYLNGRLAGVYAVFHKYPSGRLEWIGAAETEERATLLARMWSRYGNSEVIVVENGDNGRTEHRFTFSRGEQLGSGLSARN